MDQLCNESTVQWINCAMNQQCNGPTVQWVNSAHKHQKAVNSGYWPLLPRPATSTFEVHGSRGIQIYEQHQATHP
eukprot:scaffold10946_cov22-Tisochrysis_lutea.AAC.1